MTLLKGMLAELSALFVDDGSFVLAVIAWVVGAVVRLRIGLTDPVVEAVLLFLGLAILLAENVIRTGRAHAARTR